MKPNFYAVILVTAVALFFSAIFIPTLSAQEEGIGDPPKELRPPRDKFKDAGDNKHSRLDDLTVGKKWLEDVKKYRDEINTLETEREPVRKEVRSLLQQLQKTTGDEEKAELKKKIEIVANKENELDLKIAEKKKEFADRNFKLALERMIEAEVEYRETKRMIEMRDQFIKRFLRGERGHRRDRRGEDGPPDGPPDGRPEIPPPEDLRD